MITYLKVLSVVVHLRQCPPPPSSSSVQEKFEQRERSKSVTTLAHKVTANSTNNSSSITTALTLAPGFEPRKAAETTTATAAPVDISLLIPAKSPLPSPVTTPTSNSSPQKKLEQESTPETPVAQHIATSSYRVAKDLTLSSDVELQQTTKTTRDDDTTTLLQSPINNPLPSPVSIIASSSPTEEQQQKQNYPSEPCSSSVSNVTNNSPTSASIDAKIAEKPKDNIDESSFDLSNLGDLSNNGEYELDIDDDITGIFSSDNEDTNFFEIDDEEGSSNARPTTPLYSRQDHKNESTEEADSLAHNSRASSPETTSTPNSLPQKNEFTPPSSPSNKSSSPLITAIPHSPAPTLEQKPKSPLIATTLTPSPSHVEPQETAGTTDTMDNMLQNVIKSPLPSPILTSMPFSPIQKPLPQTQPPSSENKEDDTDTDDLFNLSGSNDGHNIAGLFSDDSFTFDDDEDEKLFNSLTAEKNSSSSSTLITSALSSPKLSNNKSTKEIESPTYSNLSSSPVTTSIPSMVTGINDTIVSNNSNLTPPTSSPEANPQPTLDASKNILPSLEINPSSPTLTSSTSTEKFESTQESQSRVSVDNHILVNDSNVIGKTAVFPLDLPDVGEFQHTTATKDKEDDINTAELLNLSSDNDTTSSLSDSFILNYDEDEDLFNANTSETKKSSSKETESPAYSSSPSSSPVTTSAPNSPFEQKFDEQKQENSSNTAVDSSNSLIAETLLFPSFGLQNTAHTTLDTAGIVLQSPARRRTLITATLSTPKQQSQKSNKSSPYITVSALNTPCSPSSFLPDLDTPPKNSKVTSYHETPSSSSLLRQKHYSAKNCYDSSPLTRGSSDLLSNLNTPIQAQTIFDLNTPPRSCKMNLKEQFDSIAEKEQNLSL